MDSGTVAGIAIGSSLGTVLLGGLAFVVYKKFAVPDAGSGGLNQLGLFNWFQILYYFLPYALFLFGIIYDGLARSIKFFPAGFIGLAGVYLNSILSRIISGVSSTDADVCGIPGMSTWGSRIAPQNIVFTSTVLSYIATYITASQTDSAYSATAWGGLGIIFLLQYLMYWYNTCSVSSWITGTPSFIPPFIGLAFALVIGGISGWAFTTIGGSAGDSPSKGSLGSGATQQLGTGVSSDPSVGKCSPTSGGDDDAFVCEAYKNGELVTSTIVG